MSIESYQFNFGAFDSEVFMLYRELEAAPDSSGLTRQYLRRRVGAVVYPSRAFQSEMDLRRRADPKYKEPKQGSDRWREMLAAGQQRCADEFIDQQLAARPTHFQVEGDGIKLTPTGHRRARALAKLPIDPVERWHQYQRSQGT
jgi:hypothetical protein